MASETAILIGAGLATLGWLYTGRRSRTLAKKQHTFNTLLMAAFNENFQGYLKAAAPHLKKRQAPDFQQVNQEDNYIAFRSLLNHYEFIAAAVRNGDVDEQLLKDSEKTSIIALFQTCHDHIYGLRNSRQRQSAYEHLEWLYDRWTEKPPGWFTRKLEWIIGRPIQGSRNDKK